MASPQTNLIVLACAIFCLYWAISPAEAQSSHCGYHALNHYAFTRYYSGYYEVYYYLKYGYCSSGILIREVGTVNSAGQTLYYILTYTYGKRDASALQGKLGIAPATSVKRETDLLEKDNTKRAASAAKTVQAADYSAIVKDLSAKRSTRALVKAAYGKVLKNALRSEAEAKQEE